MNKIKKVIPLEPNGDIEKLEEHILNKYVNEAQEKPDPNKDLFEVLKAVSEGEILLSPYYKSVFWISVSSFYTVIKERNLEINKVLKNELLAGAFLYLYNGTWEGLKRINLTLLSKLRERQINIEFKNKFDKHSELALRLNPYLLKLKLSDLEDFHLSYHLGDILIITHLRKLMKFDKIAAYLKEHESQKNQFVGMLKTLKDNKFGKVSVDELENRFSTFNLGEGMNFKIHLNSFLEKFIDDYNSYRYVFKEFNKVLTGDSLSNNLINFLLEILEFNSLDFITSIAITNFYNYNLKLMNNEKEAKLLTHYFLCKCSLSEFTTRQEFENRFQPESEYTKLRIKEMDRVLNKYKS